MTSVTKIRVNTITKQVFPAIKILAKT